MPNFLRTILIAIMGYAWIAALAGVGILGYAGWTLFKAGSGSAYTAEDKLKSISGKVTSASEVTVTSKRRRGGSSVSDRYYEIDVKPPTGDTQKLRMQLRVGKKNVETIIDENIVAKYDGDDNNIVYAVKMGARDILTYEQSKTWMQASADAQAKSSTGSGTLMTGGLLLALGVGGFVFKRKLEQGAPEATA